MRERMTSDFETSTRFFGRFTWKDLVRLALPILLLTRVTVASTESSSALLVAVLLGAFIGLMWYGLRPRGMPVETYLYHLIRWGFS